MTPQQPTAAVEEDVRVEHGTFSLIDPDADYWNSEPDFTDDPVLTTHPHRIWLYSAATDHYARVRLELWTTRPPGAAHDRSVTESGSFHTDGRRLCLATTVNGPVIHLPTPEQPHGAPRVHHLELPTPGHYNVEVTVTGRAEAAELPEASTRHGIETWLIRLWPDKTRTPRPGGPAVAQVGNHPDPPPDEPPGLLDHHRAPRAGSTWSSPATSRTRDGGSRRR